MLKACIDQHQVVAGGGSAPILADVAYLTVPDGLSFPKTLAMAQSSHALLLVVLDTLLERDHSFPQGMEAVVLFLI